MSTAARLNAEALRSIASDSDTYSDHVSSWLAIHAPSPPSSTRLSRKRYHRDTEPAMEEVEDTPRPKSRGIQRPSSPSSLVSGYTSQSPCSTRSGQKRRKVHKVTDLALLPEPVVIKSFDDVTAAPPDELEDMILRLREINRGIGIIPRSEKVSYSVTALLAALTGLRVIGCNHFDVLRPTVSSDTQERACLCG
jgi:hypothetical protein